MIPSLHWARPLTRLQFNYWNDPTPLWSFDRLRETRYIDHVYNDHDEDQTVKAGDVLNHPVENTEDPLLVPDFIASPEDEDAEGALYAM